MASLPPGRNSSASVHAGLGERPLSPSPTPSPWSWRHRWQTVVPRPRPGDIAARRQPSRSSYDSHCEKPDPVMSVIDHPLTPLPVLPSRRGRGGPDWIGQGVPAHRTLITQSGLTSLTRDLDLFHTGRSCRASPSPSGSCCVDCGRSHVARLWYARQSDPVVGYLACEKCRQAFRFVKG